MALPEKAMPRRGRGSGGVFFLGDLGGAGGGFFFFFFGGGFGGGGGGGEASDAAIRVNASAGVQLPEDSWRSQNDAY